MSYLLKDRDGQTPLPPELQCGLKLKHIQTMGELDEVEEANIVQGLVWLERAKVDVTRLDGWLKIHKRLFGEVWTWAGQVRSNELQNETFHRVIHIRESLRALEGDLGLWLSDRPFSDAEVAAVLHHRLEVIHPFANGNGRFGRILTEAFCKRHGLVVPTWGASYSDPGKRRLTYIEALRRADRGDLSFLTEFIAK